MECINSYEICFEVNSLFSRIVSKPETSGMERFNASSTATNRHEDGDGLTHLLEISASLGRKAVSDSLFFLTCMIRVFVKRVANSLNRSGFAGFFIQIEYDCTKNYIVFSDLMTNWQHRQKTAESNLFFHADN